MPHAFSFHGCLPQPEFISAVTVTELIEVVAATPDTVTSKALSPQFSKPQVSEPQPCSGKASTVPTLAVEDTPVKVAKDTPDCQELDPQVFSPQSLSRQKQGHPLQSD